MRSMAPEPALHAGSHAVHDDAGAAVEPRLCRLELRALAIDERVSPTNQTAGVSAAQLTALFVERYPHKTTAYTRLLSRGWRETAL